MSDLRYGNRNVAKMIRQIDALRQSIRAEGTPDIQTAWDAVEQHIDFAYRALPAVQPATDPDYCYDEAWEYTMPWGDRNTLVEWADLTKPVPIYTLIKGPTKWAVNIPLDTDGDGEADDFELTWFDSEDAALAALKGETP